MLRHAVLIVCLEQAADHVRIVPVRPHSRLGYVLRKIFVGPEQLG